MASHGAASCMAACHLPQPRGSKDGRVPRAVSLVRAGVWLCVGVCVGLVAYAHKAMLGSTIFLAGCGFGALVQVQDALSGGKRFCVVYLVVYLVVRVMGRSCFVPMPARHGLPAWVGAWVGPRDDVGAWYHVQYPTNCVTQPMIAISMHVWVTAHARSKVLWPLCGPLMAAHCNAMLANRMQQCDITA
jgi:hypothetical protein